MKLQGALENRENLILLSQHGEKGQILPDYLIALNLFRISYIIGKIQKWDLRS